MKTLIEINGVEIEVTKIYQMKTYDSLIEGTYDKELNDDILVDIKQRAKRVFYRDYSFVVDPRVNEDDNFPEFCIILELMVFKPFKDLDKDYSALTVICFQDEFAFPISSKNLYHLKEIPFELICKEYNF